MKAIEAGRRAKDKVVEGKIRLVVTIENIKLTSADNMVFMDNILDGPSHSQPHLCCGGQAERQ